MRGFLRLIHTDPGFRAEHVLTMTLELPGSGYAEQSRRAAFFRQVLENVARIPGMRGAGVTDSLPIRSGTGWGVEIDGRPPLRKGEFNLVMASQVSTGYARAMGIRLLRGRGIAASDVPAAPAVAVINEAMAKRYWPGEDPIGRRFGPPGNKAPRFTVVGITADARQFDLARPAEPAALFSYLQETPANMSLVIQTAGDPMAVAEAARRAVRAVDRVQPVSHVEPMTAIVAESVATQRVYAALLGFFGALALALALVGIYGVMACVVTERTREIGIRMALGAAPGAVVAMVLRHAVAVVALGLTIGLAGALVFTRVLESALAGVRARDAATYALASIAVLAVGLAAAWLPARRAAAVDPAIVLRDE